MPKGASASGAGKKGSLALKLAIVGLVVILAGVAAIVVYQFWKPEVKNGSSGSGETTASSGDTTETTTEPEVTYTEEELAKELGYTPASNSYTFSMTAYYRQPIRFEWDYYVDATDLGNTYLAAKYLDLDGDGEDEFLIVTSPSPKYASSNMSREGAVGVKVLAYEKADKEWTSAGESTLGLLYEDDFWCSIFYDPETHSVCVDEYFFDTNWEGGSWAGNQHWWFSVLKYNSGSWSQYDPMCDVLSRKGEELIDYVYIAKNWDDDGLVNKEALDEDGFWSEYNNFAAMGFDISSTGTTPLVDQDSSLVKLAYIAPGKTDYVEYLHGEIDSFYEYTGQTEETQDFDLPDSMMIRDGGTIRIQYTRY